MKVNIRRSNGTAHKYLHQPVAYCYSSRVDMENPSVSAQLARLERLQPPLQDVSWGKMPPWQGMTQSRWSLALGETWIFPRHMGIFHIFKQ